MREISTQSTNKVTIAGKLLDITFNTGKTKDGKPYERANMTIRVTQTYGGRTETSDIPVSSFATQFTKAGTTNPAYTSLQQLKELKSVQNVGIDDADVICMNGAQLKENAFVTKSGQLVTGWQLNSSFFNNRKVADVASFAVDIFIMDMRDELDREGDTTGRLIIKGGIVQYGGALDIVEFIVENNDTIDHISRYWQVNQTVQVRGRVRYTSVEETKAVSGDSWGEEVPVSSTKIVRELVVTTGDDEDEDKSYDATEIKKAFNARKARHEQLMLEAKTTAQPKPAASKSLMGWE